MNINRRKTEYEYIFVLDFNHTSAPLFPGTIDIEQSHAEPPI